MVRIEFVRSECIGDGACTAVDPENWEMADDGLVNLVGGKEEGDVWVKEITPEALECMKEAAESCPQAIIHVKE